MHCPFRFELWLFFALHADMQTESIHHCRIQCYSSGVSDSTWQHHQYQYWSASTRRPSRTRPYDRRMSTRYGDRLQDGSLSSSSSEFENTPLWEACTCDTHIFILAISSRTLSCACFCFAGSFPIYHPPLFEILFF